MRNMYPLLSNPTLHVSFKQTLSWEFIDVTLSRDCFMATETAVEIQRTYLEMSTRYYCIEWDVRMLSKKGDFMFSPHW